MNKSTIYAWISAVSGFIGIGMILGANLANGTSDTPLWIGGILILLAAIILGMAITSRADRPRASNVETNDDTNLNNDDKSDPNV